MANYNRIIFSDKNAIDKPLEVIGKVTFKDSRVNLRHIIIKTHKETRRLKNFPNRNEIKNSFIDLIHNYLIEKKLYITDVTCYRPRGQTMRNSGKIEGFLYEERENLQTIKK